MSWDVALPLTMNRCYFSQSLVSSAATGATTALTPSLSPRRGGRCRTVFVLRKIISRPLVQGFNARMIRGNLTLALPPSSLRLCRRLLTACSSAFQRFYLLWHHACFHWRVMTQLWLPSPSQCRYPVAPQARCKAHEVFFAFSRQSINFNVKTTL